MPDQAKFPQRRIALFFSFSFIKSQFVSRNGTKIGKGERRIIVNLRGSNHRGTARRAPTSDSFTGRETFEVMISVPKRLRDRCQSTKGMTHL